MGKFVVFEIEGSRYAVGIERIQRIEPYFPEKDFLDNLDNSTEVHLVNFPPSQKLLGQVYEGINLIYLNIDGKTYVMPVPRKLDITEIEKFSQNPLIKKVSKYFEKVGLADGKPVLVLDIERLS